MPTAKPSNIAR